jgi:outer membrane protein OmpA-like peptidoglycan-associated protein
MANAIAREHRWREQMYQTRLRFLWMGMIAATLALATAGCATKAYVRAQIVPVNTKVGALDVKTNEQTEKEQNDISRVEEKLGSTDSKVAEVASSAQEANATADRANQLAQQDESAIASDRYAIAVNSASIVALDQAMTYSLVARADVTFAFDKSELGEAGEAALDALAQQVQSTPRVVFELVGFTDPVGTADYNLALSRRRAESVARYLVHHGIPLEGIHIIGLGKEPVPAGLLAELAAADPNVTEADARRLARRVVIRIYVPNATVQTSFLE